MNPGIQDLKKKNAIAYNRPLRDQLETVHKLLGSEITDVANTAMNYGIKFQPSAEGALKIMSKLASDLSVLLLEAKKEKESLSTEEESDYDAIKSLTDVLGNLQFELNRIVKLSKKFYEIAEELLDEGVSLGETIIEAQASFREVRIDINALGFLSRNKDIAYLFEDNAE